MDPVIQEQPEPYRPLVAVDFDGVIHDYREGWKDGTIYGEVVPGFFEWLTRAQKHVTVTIHTSRVRAPTEAEMSEKVRIVVDWLSARYKLWLATLPEPLPIEDCVYVWAVTCSKPAAIASIDDRAVRFDGNWSAPELDPATLAQFKPWNKA